MGRLGNYVRHLLRGNVIAVAGSNGKTGTKNLIHSVLKKSLNGTISPKSFNNDIGVPTTIFAAEPADNYVVLEVGTNHHGEVLNLTTIAEPDIAVITNIGAEHLEFLDDLDGVTRENAQIIAGLNPEGLLVVNGDCPALVKAVENFVGTKITFGLGEHNDLQPIGMRCLADGVRFRLRNLRPIERRAGLSDMRHTSTDSQRDRLVSEEIYIPQMGRHTAVNALAAIAVARYLGIDDGKILEGFATAIGPEMRLQLQAAGTVKILNDAYNANPHSMHAALETLRDMETPGRRVAVLGDMKELGTATDRYHHEIGLFAATCGIDHLICVGEKAQLIADAAIQAGLMPGQVERFKSAAEWRTPSRRSSQTAT